MSSESTASPTRTPSSDAPLQSPNNSNNIGSHNNSVVSPITPKSANDVSSPRASSSSAVSSTSAGPRLAVIPPPQSSAQLPSISATTISAQTSPQPTISSLAHDSPQRTSLAAHIAVAATPLNLANIPSGSATTLFHNNNALPGPSNGIVSTSTSSNNSTREINGTGNDDAQTTPSPDTAATASAVAANKLDAQRTRRSSRNLEESSRRRSSRSSRQTSAQTAQSGRTAGVPIRPSLDLPPGYGKSILFFI